MSGSHRYWLQRAAAAPPTPRLPVGPTPLLPEELIRPRQEEPIPPRRQLAEGDITIGVAWNNFNEPRWANADKPAIQAVLEEAGAAYIESDARLFRRAAARRRGEPDQPGSGRPDPLGTGRDRDSARGRAHWNRGFPWSPMTG